MKKRILILSLLLIALLAHSQDTVKKDTAWKLGGLAALTVSQSSFTNWASGGENSYSVNGRFGLYANYVKTKVQWENNLDVAYGKAKQGENALRKTDDVIELNSKFGYKASKKWFYSAVFNAKTQLDDGFDYAISDSIPVSESFAPLYINLGLGMDYKPNKFTSVFIAPLNMKNVYVKDTKYSPRFSIDSSKNVRTDLGALVKFKYQKELVKNLNFLTKLDLFANYLELNSAKDIDVNWEILITMNVFKVFSINLNTVLVWDNDVKFDETDDSKVQFKEIFGAGIAYNF